MTLDYYVTDIRKVSCYADDELIWKKKTKKSETTKTETKIKDFEIFNLSQIQPKKRKEGSFPQNSSTCLSPPFCLR